MSCTCSARADECDGEFATHHPLQDSGSCVVRPCQKRGVQVGTLGHTIPPGGIGPATAAFGVLGAPKTVDGGM